MLQKIKKVVTFTTDLRILIELRFSGYLEEKGWFNAYRKTLPLTKNDEPLPFYTYPMIDFLTPRLIYEFEIFEFGAGYSTIYFSKRGKHITTVEHDSDWYETMTAILPDNVTLIYQEFATDGDYCKTAQKTGKRYDIIIIDGRDRVNCIKQAIDTLKGNGVMILDDAERERYREGISFLLNKDFRKIDFWGMSPGSSINKNTALFYKENNCLDI